MQLGTFSVSLAVKDIKLSREFYEKLGFRVIAGNQDENWLILINDTNDAKIGIFQGMFAQNVLTFNPQDVRDIQRKLKADGITFTLEADESTEGAAHATLVDPDGNAILLDQHA